MTKGREKLHTLAAGCTDRMMKLLGITRTARTSNVSVDIPRQWMIVIECRDESSQVELLNRFVQEGLKCRALIS